MADIDIERSRRAKQQTEKGRQTGDPCLGYLWYIPVVFL